MNTIVYDRAEKGYRLETPYQIRPCCVSEVSQKRVLDLIRNEEYHYVEPQHKTNAVGVATERAKVHGEILWMQRIGKGD